MILGLSGYISSGKDTVAKMIQFFTLVPPSKRDFGIYQGGTLQHRTHPWEVKKFAGKLKQIVSLLTGIPVADLEKESVKSSELGSEWYRWACNKSTDRFFSSYEEALEWCKWQPKIMQPCEPTIIKLTVRMLLQKLGTDAMRDQVHPNVHINALFTDYKSRIEGRITPKLSGGMGSGNTVGVPVYPNWVISDLRFPNEFKAIKDRGGICIRIDRGKEYWNDPEWLAGKKVYSQPINLHPSETALDQAEFDYTIQNSGTMEELLEAVRTMLLHFKIIT